MKLPLIQENGSIHVNRGDQLIITLNNDVNFSVGDEIKFSIMKKGNCEEVLFQKIYTVEEESNIFDLVLTSDETRIGNFLKSGTMTYWYEIEYNGINTLTGFDTEGAKEFVLYPEAAEKRGE